MGTMASPCGEPRGGLRARRDTLGEHELRKLRVLLARRWKLV